MTKESSCTCPKCVEMCKFRPCWPTPEEALAIIEAGYGLQLMRDYWESDGVTSYRDILCPAVVGYEHSSAPFWPTGRCTFLTDDNLCELHEPGLKPLEGRVASCKTPNASPTHEEIAMMWDSKKHEHIIDKWCDLES